MQVALIPPICRLHQIVNRPYQMIIPNGLNWPAYREAYYAVAGKHFTILDNGMFEDGAHMQYEALINLALHYKVSEIVMPDVRENMRDTLTKTDRFLNVFCDSDAVDKKVGLQIVMQVDSASQIPDFVHYAQELEWDHFGHGNVFTFGLPRRMIETCGDQGRLAAVDFITAICDNPIHLLGYARTESTQVNEPLWMAHIKQVRSIDTDAPFVYAYRNAKLIPGTVYERPDNYLNAHSERFSEDLVNENISRLDGWANA